MRAISSILSPVPSTLALAQFDGLPTVILQFILEEESPLSYDHRLSRDCMIAVRNEEWHCERFAGVERLTYLSVKWSISHPRNGSTRAPYLLYYRVNDLGGERAHLRRETFTKQSVKRTDLQDIIPKSGSRINPPVILGTRESSSNLPVSANDPGLAVILEFITMDSWLFHLISRSLFPILPGATQRIASSSKFLQISSFRSWRMFMMNIETITKKTLVFFYL